METKMTEIKKEFRNPSSKYRSAPFWSWNDVMEKEELQFQLRDFKSHGIGGAFAHPRIGMVTEYLSEDFFRAFKDCLDTVKEEDMKLYMYDENAWPSGFAGGKKSDGSEKKKEPQHTADNAMQSMEAMGFTPMPDEFDDDLPFNMN